MWTDGPAFDPVQHAKPTRTGCTIVVWPGSTAGSPHLVAELDTEQQGFEVVIAVSGHIWLGRNRELPC